MKGLQEDIIGMYQGFPAAGLPVTLCRRLRTTIATDP